MSIIEDRPTGYSDHDSLNHWTVRIPGAPDGYAICGLSAPHPAHGPVDCPRCFHENQQGELWERDPKAYYDPAKNPGAPGSSYLRRKP